ncbi:MAG TPA: putative glycolipid-binding domain-containing protein [Thermomicrobiaceae bacterium]|nr:putative glycolipid-binding domain-containing protein [Thermomicrobiaceae bacterium]
MERDILWTPWSEVGIEHLHLSLGPDGSVADSEIVRVIEGGPLRLHFRLETDAAWRARRLHAEAPYPAGARLSLASDGAGHWVDDAGQALPELDGCYDVDIAATPFTNTLPVRRLGLAEGQSAEISVVYVGIPELRPRPARQRYTWLRATADGAVYRYEGLETGFSVDLAVDRDGIVLDYPGIWRRVWPPLAPINT